jgi:NADH:ubiquinone oxidoreductase subunit 2 (subunit N)
MALLATVVVVTSLITLYYYLKIYLSASIITLGANNIERRKGSVRIEDEEKIIV